jgi:hypothetical protein
MSLLENSSNVILSTIHKYRKEYVEQGLLPELLYCGKNDGTHMPMIPQSPDGENVYLYCLSCGYQKTAGLVTADDLNTYMRWRDLNPGAQILTVKR